MNRADPAIRPMNAIEPPRRVPALLLLLAFGSGGILTLMILCNGTIAAHTNGHFSSLAAHGSGTFAAGLALAILPAARMRWRGDAPLWAFSGGLMGAVTVALGTIAVNSPLALSGMIALGLLGQVFYSLAADRFGWFGLPARRPDRRDALVVALILSGCLLIVMGGGA